MKLYIGMAAAFVLLLYITIAAKLGWLDGFAAWFDQAVSGNQ